MPSRHTYWVIIAGNTPTAFRSKTQEELLPTLHQLQRKQPNVTLQWFERGRLWASPLDARAAAKVRSARKPAGWRPGGEHKDPRARFELTRDEKRARFKQRARRASAAGPNRPAGPAARGPKRRP